MIFLLFPMLIYFMTGEFEINQYRKDVYLVTRMHKCNKSHMHYTRGNVVRYRNKSIPNPLNDRYGTADSMHFE